MKVLQLGLEASCGVLHGGFAPEAEQFLEFNLLHIIQ